MKSKSLREIFIDIVTISCLTDIHTKDTTVPTKLRYLKKSVEAKIREVLTKNIYWLDEFHIRHNHEHNPASRFPQKPFWTQWERILRDETLLKNAKKVTNAYEEEGSERILHAEAIQHEERKSPAQKKSKAFRQVNPNAGNTLPNVPDNVTKLLNFWLGKNSNCNQVFNT